MATEYFGNDSVHLFIGELTARIVAESGIPSDRFHLGKIILQSLKDDTEFVMQVDGATGETENNGSILRRSIQCANSLRNMGVEKGDVIVLMAPNHLNLAVPFYAGLYLGLAVAPTDRTMNIHDLKHSFEGTKPKVVFCQSEKLRDIQEVVELLKIETKIFTFDKSSDVLSLAEMMDTYGGNVNVQNFKATDFDPEETISLLIATSGTAGLPKAAAVTHKNMAIATPYIWSFSTTFPSPTRSALNVAPLQWLSTLINFVLSPILKYLRIQSSAPVTTLHTMELIKKYEPTFFITSPTLFSTLLKTAEEENYKLSSFEFLLIGGSAVSTKLLEQIQLVDVETKEDINEPNRPGELWLKGPSIFKGYYNNQEATNKVFAEDRWFMTGDLLYRDASFNYYFVERIKSLLKYRNHQISPVELETVIRQHPSVLDVAVTGVPDYECGELPIACVVLRPGMKATVDEIKQLVKEKLSDSKQLRGGVIFLEELPLTASTKVHRREIKQIVMNKLNELKLQKD